MRKPSLLLTVLFALFIPFSGVNGEPRIEWQSGFGLPGLDGQVYALASFDDGTGEALFAGGAMISVAGESRAAGVAKWNGKQWAPIALLERGGTVNALAVYDDGTGAKLYTGTAYGIISAWNGSAWSELPRVRGLESVQALAVFDDGSGPAMYAAGSVAGVGTRDGSNVARWDGKNWFPVGTEKEFDCVWCLAVFDDGSGPALYAGGWQSIRGEFHGKVARWNGKKWSTIGTGMNDTVFALRAYDPDGAGPQHPMLYAGGGFTSADSQPARHIARWDGTQWKQVGAGAECKIRAMAVLDRPSRQVLIAGGNNQQTEHESLPNTGGSISQWDGKQWSSLGSVAVNDVLAMAVYNDGHGPTLFAGGQFEQIGSTVARGVAKWTGSDWESLGTGGGVRSPISALCAREGRQVYAGGMFRTAGLSVVNGIAIWDGKTWSPLGDGVQDPRYLPTVRALHMHEGSLYIGGQFSEAGKAKASNIAQWTGSEWKSLGAGMDAAVWALAWRGGAKDGLLYAGGDFHRADNADAKCIAQWDGHHWHALGAGMSNTDRPEVQLARSNGDPHLDRHEAAPLSVRAIEIFDDGHGGAVYAGGFFDRAGDQEANSVAKWTGSEWVSLEHGVRSGAIAGQIHAMTAWNDGPDSGLYVGGQFDHAGESAAVNIARWDGTHWKPLGSGLPGTIRALMVFDDGHGPALYAAGSVGYIARWDGNEWTSVATTPGVVSAMTNFMEGSSRGLCVGGLFPTIGDRISVNFACGVLKP